MSTESSIVLDENDQIRLERQPYLGGTDISAAFSDRPFGCARRLQYEKLGTEPDFPFRETPAMRLGKHLEAFIAEEYTRATRRTLVRTEAVIDPRYPWKRASPDRLVDNDPNGKVAELGLGSWEAKSVPAWFWEKVQREGAPKSEHVRQVHWSIDTAQLRWGVMCLMNKQTGELLFYDFLLDVEFADQMTEFGSLWWQRHIVDRVPCAPLPEIDDRCRTCSYRVRCRGSEDLGELEHPNDDAPVPFETPELRYAVDLYVSARDVKSSAEKEYAAAQDTVRDALSVIGPDGSRTFSREAVLLHDGTKIYYRTQGRTAFDLDALRSAPPILDLGTYEPARQLRALEAVRALGIPAAITTIREKYEQHDPEHSRPLRVYPPKKRRER